MDTGWVQLNNNMTHIPSSLALQPSHLLSDLSNLCHPLGSHNIPEFPLGSTFPHNLAKLSGFLRQQLGNIPLPVSGRSSSVSHSDQVFRCPSRQSTPELLARCIRGNINARAVSQGLLSLADHNRCGCVNSIIPLTAGAVPALLLRMLRRRTIPVAEPDCSRPSGSCTVLSRYDLRYIWPARPLKTSASEFVPTFTELLNAIAVVRWEESHWQLFSRHARNSSHSLWRLWSAVKLGKTRKHFNGTEQPSKFAEADFQSLQD
eukprot:2831330-Rhodomonas_salina.6